MTRRVRVPGRHADRRPARPRWLDDVLRGVRWAAILIWVVASAFAFYNDGVPFDRTGLLLWVSLGLIAASIGRRSAWTVVADFAPLGAVLIAYDYLRGISESMGMPTWWYPQADADRVLFFGHFPTVWLQERLKHPDVRWYDVLVCVCYLSFFFLPYLTAGVLWLRSRADFYRWTLRFVALSFLGFLLFALIPSAPPWAAAQCTPDEVSDRPNNPLCLIAPVRPVPHGGLLGEFHHTRPGAAPYVERIVLRGFSQLHLGVARTLLTESQRVVDQVAAVPSLHAGGTMLFVLFMWPRVRWGWKPLLVAYPLVMAFSLAYSGEHYISDQLAGWLCAVLVNVLAGRIERPRGQRRLGQRRRGKLEPAPDTLENQLPPTAEKVETSCPPMQPLPETTQSST